MIIINIRKGLTILNKNLNKNKKSFTINFIIFITLTFSKDS